MPPLNQTSSASINPPFPRSRPKADHAAYLASVASHAAREWRLRFRTVEPLNEPLATWWRPWGTQEGCHFSHAAQVWRTPHGGGGKGP